MATATKLHCAVCHKPTGTFSCRGCEKDFCLKHANEHRQDLHKQMDEHVILLHDQLKQQIQEHVDQSIQRSFIKQIDQWEQISIEQIHHQAQKYRKELVSFIDKHTRDIKQRLDHLTQQLRKARDDDYFFENDLKQWTDKLQQLKQDFYAPSSIHIHKIENNESLLSKLVINQQQQQQQQTLTDDDFQQTVGKISISEQNKVITHNITNQFAFVRGRRDYSQGQHSFCFKIENISAGKWAFFGIISKSAPNQITNNRPTPKSYGFSGDQVVWLDGKLRKNLNGYNSDFRINDTILLLINCDLRKLTLTNQRTNTRLPIDVDIDKCPFPWQLCLGLYYAPGESIRMI